MKLLNDLFTIVSDQEQPTGHDYTIALNPEHFIYQAHFPDEPITPGVCIMQIAQELLQETVGEALVVEMVKNVKFLRIISPLEVNELCYSLRKITAEDDLRKVQVQVSQGDNVYAKLSLVCRVQA